MVEIIVCIKQILDVTQIKVDSKSLTPKVEGVPKKISDFDKNALEEAIRLKEKHGGKVIVVTAGPPGAKDAIKEALAMGADEASVLYDPSFITSDTLITATILACIIKKIEKWNMILCAEASIDEYSAQVGPRLAEALNLPQITYVRKLEIVDGNKVVAERDLEDCYEVVESEFPVLLTVNKEINEPRLPTLLQIVSAKKKKITEWTLSELGFSKEDIEKLSAMQTLEIIAPKIARKRIMLDKVEDLSKKILDVI
ncbi:MAG: electron transfer flavoprotein subunit beta/FixA family protein [Methanosarcinales archaeon]